MIERAAGGLYLEPSGALCNIMEYESWCELKRGKMKTITNLNQSSVIA